MQSGSLTPELPNGAPLRFICSWKGPVSGYFPRHSHPVMELVYHPRGAGVTTLADGRAIHFEAHGIVIYPPNTLHDQRMIVPGIDICLHLAAEADWNNRPTETLYLPPLAKDGRADPLVRTEFLHLARIRADETREIELNLRATALVHRLLQLGREEATKPPRTATQTYLETARSYIREKYASITSIQEIARHVEVSEDHLRHLFLAHGGISLVKLLTKTRLERAKELIIHSRLPLKEIAALSGFATERYLSTRFREAFGSSPGTFRRIHTEANRFGELG